jgi:hypothetical protein
MIQLFKRLAVACLLASAGAVVADAQWLNYKVPGVPRTPDGKPKLDAPAPRALDGHPDLSGVWMHDLTPIPELRRLYGPLVDEAIKNELPGMEVRNVHKYVINILADFGSSDSPARPETAKAYLQRLINPAPQDLCDPILLFGFPLAGLLAEPIKLVQAPRLTLVLYEVGDVHRQIYTDGRTLPAEFNLPAYYGYSVGRWERDTFIVETGGFNEKTRLDIGHPHSDQLHVVERYRRPDFGRLEVDMTFDDPKMYLRPFTVRLAYHLLADDDIFEMFSENEKDCAHTRPALGTSNQK